MSSACNHQTQPPMFAVDEKNILQLTEANLANHEPHDQQSYHRQQSCHSSSTLSRSLSLDNESQYTRSVIQSHHRNNNRNHHTSVESELLKRAKSCEYFLQSDRAFIERSKLLVEKKIEKVDLAIEKVDLKKMILSNEIDVLKAKLNLSHKIKKKQILDIRHKFTFLDQSNVTKRLQIHEKPTTHTNPALTHI